MILWMDSVMFSHDPLSGVYSGMMPCSNSHTTKRVVRWPANLVRDGEALKELRGTVILLADNHFRDDEIVEWLLEQNETLDAAPIDARRSGRKTEVRRVAQALAF